MNIDAYMNLQLFAEEGAAAAGAEAAGAGTAAETGTADAAGISAGDELANGTQVSPQVAAAMNRQMKRHPELRKVYSRGMAAPQAAAQPAQPAAQPVQPEQPEQTPDGNDPESRWEQLRKGEFRDQYARDVQNAIRERFKNQEDLQGKLNAMQPMLDALMKKTGAENVDELQQMILDDDSLYEDEAEQMGMPVEAYKNFKKLQEEHDAAIAREQQNQQQMFFRQHIANLAQQGEELKKTFPNFDFQAEMQNDTFRRLTSPEVGISVADAYFAIHRNELTPQLLGYGMQRAQQQMGQTLQAQAARPAEGAMRNQGQAAADVRLNPATMTRKERNEIKRRVRLGEKVSFD